MKKENKQMNEGTVNITFIEYVGEISTDRKFYGIPDPDPSLFILEINSSEEEVEVGVIVVTILIWDTEILVIIKG